MPETKKYYHNLDVDNNKVINLLLNPLTTAQRLAVGTLLTVLDEGYTCYDTTLDQQFFWDGTSWTTVTASTTWGSITGTITSQTDLITYLSTNYYPLSSNPANYIDLTDLSAGTGISYNNLTGVITNTAPDQTVVLNSGTGISVSGTYPNFTITNTGLTSVPTLDQVLTAGNTSTNQIILQNNSPYRNTQIDSSQVSIDTISGTITYAARYNSISDTFITINSLTSERKQVQTTVDQIQWFKGTLLNPTQFQTTLLPTNLISTSVLQLPSASGILALSVNGQTANSSGQITIPVGTGTVTGTGTATRVAFWDTSSSISSDSALYWDNSNKRLGVGTATPAYKLDVNGNESIQGYLNFKPSAAPTSIRISSNDILNGGSASNDVDRLVLIGNNVATNLSLKASNQGDSLIGIGYGAANSTTTGGIYSVHIGRSSGAGITTGAYNTHIGSGDATNIPSSTRSTIHIVAAGGYQFNNAASVLTGLTSRYAFIGGGFSSAEYINNFYLGAGPFVTDPNLANLAIFAPSGVGTDLQGANFTFNAGRGTGSGTPGDLIFQTSTSGAPGTTLQTLSQRVKIAGQTGDVTINNLSGVGTRMVVADSGGLLSTQTIPTFTSPLTTKGDIYVRNATVDTRLPVGLDTQILIADSSTTTGLKWGTNTAATPTGYYGAWQDSNTQTAAASNVGYPMIFNTTDLSNGVTMVSDGTNLTRITFANTGIYNIQFSVQIQKTDNAEHDVTIWIRKNGVDVPGSAGFVQVPKRRAAGAGNEGHLITGWNYVLSIVAGEYYQIIWSTTNNANVTLQYYAAGNPPPSTASTLVTVTQQSGIMAGTGITAINSLTGAAQTLVTGTTGTDFGISSVGTTHTFNLPTASATNTGKLSSTDWSTFNGKVDGSGTTNYIPKLTASTTIGNSQIFDNGTSVGINTASPAASSLLDMTSTARGLLIPRMTTAQINAIASPAQGLMAFDTSYNSLVYYDTNFGDWWSDSQYWLAYNGFSVFDDFMTYSYVTNYNGQVFQIQNANASTWNNVTPLGNRPGVLQISTGVNAAGRITVQGDGIQLSSFIVGGGKLVYETDVQIQTLSDGTNTFRFFTGFSSSSTLPTVNSIMFLYDASGISTGSAATPNWQVVCSVNPTRTFTTTSTAVVAGTWYRLKIEINAAGNSVGFYINGVLAATIATNIPTGALTPVTTLFKSAGTTARTAWLDFIRIRQKFTTPR